jgi:hypothetical protein
VSGGGAGGVGISDAEAAGANVLDRQQVVCHSPRREITINWRLSLRIGEERAGLEPTAIGAAPGEVMRHESTNPAGISPGI